MGEDYLQMSHIRICEFQLHDTGFLVVGLDRLNGDHGHGRHIDMMEIKEGVTGRTDDYFVTAFASLFRPRNECLTVRLQLVSSHALVHDIS